MGESFEVSYRKNKIASVVLLVLSPIIFYYDYNVYVINEIASGEIYLKLIIASIIGLISSLGIVGLWYLSVSNDWDNYVKSIRRNRKERIGDLRAHIRFFSLRVATMPFAIIIAYSMSALIVSPVTILYFLILGSFLFWALILKKKSVA